MNTTARVLVIVLILPALMMASGQASQESRDVQRATAPSDAIFLDSLDVSRTVQDEGTTVAGASADKNPITLLGARYPHGVGMHANAELAIQLNAAAKSFVSMVGVDDETHRRGSVAFEVWTDGRRAAATGKMKGGDDPRFITVDLTGAKTMTLVATDAGDGNSWDHADWAGAIIFLQPGSGFHPATFVRTEESAPAIQPDRSPRPSIN
ncbi:MAG: NPCBM/NEW2 domain-containing protein, partial [Blastocatellia bacterium]